MALNAEEVALKANVRSLMHEHKKKAYESATMTITLEKPEGEEIVKVRVKKPKAEEEPNE